MRGPFFLSSRSGWTEAGNCPDPGNLESLVSGALFNFC